RARIVSALTALAFFVHTTTLASAPIEMRASSSDKPSGVELQCARLADSPQDPHRVGQGVALEQIRVEEALPVCQQAAAGLTGQPNLHYQLDYGRVLEAAHRYEDAFQHYLAAAESGYPTAFVYLAYAYEFGIGTERNLQQAAEWYQKAADLGFSTAMDELGRLYESGNGVAGDPQRAVNLYYKAGEGGLPDGYADLSAFYMSYQPPKYADALKWAQLAAQGGSPQGMADLAWFYETG